MKCLKCGKNFEENEIEDPSSLKYPSCKDCWKEWTTNGVMVIYEMHLDMSLPEQSKVLRKYERALFVLDKVEELKKNPEDPGTP